MPKLQVIPVSIYFDAAMFKSNHGNCPMGIGIYVKINGEDAPQYYQAFYGGMGTNNVGEWIGLVYALKTAYKIIKHFKAAGRIDPLIYIYGDSQLVVRQFNGMYKTNDNFKLYKRQCDEIYSKIDSYVQVVGHVRREFNLKADELSKKGIARFYAEVGEVFNPVTRTYDKIKKNKTID